MNQQIKREGLVSIIKYDEDNETLVWKHPADDFKMGTQLIVHESQEAVFFKDGRALDVFGAGRYTLETQRLPLLDQFFKLPSDTERTYHSEIYYINLATQMGIKWGTDSKIRFLEPRSGMPIEIGACGEFNIRVSNSRKLLLKVIGTASGFDRQNLLGENGEKGYFQSLVITQVKSSLAQIIKEENISILEIDAELLRLSDILKTKINGMFEEYGLIMPDFFINRVITPDDNPNYRRMKEQYAQQYLLVKQEEIRRKEAEAVAERKAVEAQTEVRLKVIEAQGSAEILRIQKSAEAEGYKMQAAAEAAEMQMKGYTYQQETSRLVGMEAMKNGIANGAGTTSVLGDLAELGVGLGAMGGVMNMTKDALSPLSKEGVEMGQAMGEILQTAWNCPCGQSGNTGNFCSNCGRKRSE
ncbi:MAG: SPFH domain-containing protein [Lachnospiraceae bacterium]|nr:SPFH domain-containing protein [Lachnospiraceae bacterium]